MAQQEDETRDAGPPEQNDDRLNPKAVDEDSATSQQDAQQGSEETSAEISQQDAEPDSEAVSGDEIHEGSPTPDKGKTTDKQPSAFRWKVQELRSRVSTALAPVTSSKPAQALARFGRAFRAIWQKCMRFSYAFYAIAFVITNAVAVLFIQWSVYNEPTYADPNAVDETTKMLNSVRGQLTSFVSQMWLGGRYTSS